MAGRRKYHRKSPVRTTKKTEAIAKKKSQKQRRQNKINIVEKSSLQCTCLPKRRMTRAAARELSKTSFTSLSSTRKTRKTSVEYKENVNASNTLISNTDFQMLTLPEEQLLNNVAYTNQTSVFNGIQPDILNYVDEFGDGTVQISVPDGNIKNLNSNDSLIVNDVLDMMEKYGLLESNNRDVNFSELHEELMSDGESVTDTKCNSVMFPTQENNGNTV